MGKRQAAGGGVAMSVAVLLAFGLGQTGIEIPGEITAAGASVIGFIGKVLGDWMDGE